MSLHKPSLRIGLLASALVMGAFTAALPLTPRLNVPAAQAQSRFTLNVGFDSFHDELSRYGDWVYSDRWGMVWVPADVASDFHPYYTDGRWEPTREYGWMWVSDYEWGDIPFHYGRWVNDPYDGWMWIPGYVWSPGWVVWRGNDQYMGWMPLPPDDDFIRGYESVSIRYSNYDRYDDFYGYGRWYGRDYNEDRFARAWVFIGIGNMGERDYRRHAMREPRQVIDVINQTRNVTNYTVVNNYIVNRSVGPQLEWAGRRGGDRPPRAAAELVRRPNMIRTVDEGRQFERRAEQDAPRGRGAANSAPRPSQEVVNNLSTERRARGGLGGTGRLFTRETINTAPMAPTSAAAGGDRGRPERADRAREDGQRRANEERAQRDQQQRADQERRASEQRAQQDEQRRAGQERRANDERNQRDQQQRVQQERQANEQRAQQDQQRRTDQERQANEERAQRDQQQRAAQQRQGEQQRQAEQQRRAAEQQQHQAEQEQRRAADQQQRQQQQAEQQRRQNEERARANRAEQPPKAQEPQAQDKGNERRGRGDDDDKAKRGRGRD